MINRLIHTNVKRIIPRSVKERLRGIQAGWSFRRSMHRFMDDPEACLGSSNPTLMKLSEAWGNEGWSASIEYLTECISQTLTVQGSILECGSGLSTLLIAAAARRRDSRLWSLEHTPEWAKRVQNVLDNYLLRNATLCTKALRDYGTFTWYDPPLEQFPSTFGLVICDGPPATTKGGRYGLAVLKDRLRPGCIILLDDAVREEEMRIAKRWAIELNAELEVCGEIRRYVRLRIK